MNLRLFRCIFIALFFAAVGAPSIRAEASSWLHEVRFGVLHHDTDDLWSSNSREEGIDLNGEMVFAPAWEILGGAIRPNLGLSLNTHGDTSKLYLGGVYEIEWDSGFFFDLAFGGAVHNGEKKSDAPDKKDLGSHVLFRTGIEIGYSLTEHHRISLMFDHISNADLAEPNAGLDTLGIRYGYRF